MKHYNDHASHKGKTSLAKAWGFKVQKKRKRDARKVCPACKTNQLDEVYVCIACLAIACGACNSARGDCGVCHVNFALAPMKRQTAIEDLMAKF